MLYQIGGWGTMVFVLVCLCLVLVVLILIVIVFVFGMVRAENRVLKLYNIYIYERVMIIYKCGGRYDCAGFVKINQFFCDWWCNELIKMDRRFLDLVWEVYC